MHLFGLSFFLLCLGFGHHVAGNPTQCQDMCPDPQIEHGNAITQDPDDSVYRGYDYYQLFKNDTTVGVQCDQSYWFSGTKKRDGTMICRVKNCTARWEPSDKEACRAARCSPIPFHGGVLKESSSKDSSHFGRCVTTGRDLDTSIAINEYACLVCHPGFRIRFRAQVYCGADGRWEVRNQCEKQFDCQRPSSEKDLSRRFIRISTFDARRGRMEFKCIRDNFLMFGDRVVRCGENGNWSIPWPVCRYKWSCLLSINNGSVIRIPTAHPPPLGPWARHNDHGVALCDPGYTLSAGDRRIKCKKGDWDPQPICTRSPRPLPTSAHT